MQPERDDRRDRDLLARLAAGESSVLGDLYDRHAASLYRHACALVGQRDEANDLVQAVFVKVATTGAALLGVRQPASYMHRMLRTSWIDEQRRRTARPEQPLEAVMVSARAAQGACAGQDNRLDVERALMALPDTQKEVVVLHALVGFSLRETGQIAGVSTFTAASRYRLAIARMRKALKGR